MRTTGKKLICYTSRKQSLLRKEISPKNKNGCRISFNRSRRCRFKPQSHRVKAGMSKSILNEKHIETLQKISDRLSAKHLSSSQLLGKKTSCSGHRGFRKNATRNGAIIKTDKRKKRKTKKKNGELDETYCLQRRARYLLIKMKLEQNLIDAYSGDGWNGQSREKIRPEKELQRAENQILKCKLSIRDAIRQLALLSSEGSIQESVIYPDGSVFHEHIFCAKCKTNEAFADNDIILCDGTCNCGFHQKCLEPPLEKIPPGDQGWLCKFCECKMEILEAINAHLGTRFTVNNNWEDVFKEATISPDVENKFRHPAEEWPSEDSEDEDYFPERTENSNSRTDIEESISDDAGSLSGLFCSSDEARSHSIRSEHHSSDEGSQNHVKHRSKLDCVGSFISIDSVEASDREITSYRRQRRDVDYKKLHDEMFGKEPTDSEQQSEDQDWGPRRKKQKSTELDAATSLDGRRGEAGFPNVVSNEKSLRNRKPRFRIPSSAVEKLRQVFSENELPSRAVKENLSEQLGISSEKITRWFRNARYAALKTRKEETTNRPHINNITRRSTTSAIKNQRSSEVSSMDDSCLVPLSSIIRVPKKLKRILRRKASKPITTPLSKKHKPAAKALPSDKVQVSTWFANAMHLKRKMYDSRREFPLEKKLNPKETSVSQIDDMTYNERLCLVEIERLCCLEDRVQKLKTLLESENNDHASQKPHSRGERVIYVTVAEVKEKE